MKARKIMIFIAILVIITLAFIPKDVYAGGLIQNIMNTASNWTSYGEASGGSIIPTSDIQKEFIPIGQLLVAIASVVIIVVTGIMGIKYITANPEEKGKLKQQLIGLVVSIVVVYGAVGIWTLVQNVIKEMKI